MRFSPSCVCCNYCDICEHVPHKYRTIITGVTNGSCTDCLVINGTQEYTPGTAPSVHDWVAPCGTTCCVPFITGRQIFCYDKTVGTVTDLPAGWYFCIFDQLSGCSQAQIFVRYKNSEPWNCLGSNVLHKDAARSTGSSYCNWPDTIIVEGVPGNEKQTIQQSGAVVTFTLTFAGQTTSTIPGGATSVAIQTALEGLSNIGSGNVSCTGGPLGVATVVVEFIGSLGNTAVPQITASSVGGTIGTGTLEEGCCDAY